MDLIDRHSALKRATKYRRALAGEYVWSSGNLNQVFRGMQGSHVVKWDKCDERKRTTALNELYSHAPPSPPRRIRDRRTTASTRVTSASGRPWTIASLWHLSHWKKKRVWTAYRKSYWGVCCASCHRRICSNLCLWFRKRFTESWTMTTFGSARANIHPTRPS
jgi:hypothetical protein